MYYANKEVKINMGEALISRAGGGTGNGGSSEPDIPVLPGYHTTLITLKDYQNKAMPNYTINCKDGASWYNYTTNEKGQALFTTNSGSANFIVLNNIGARYLDFNTTTMNIDAPLGQTSQHNLVLNKFNGYINLTASGNYRFLNPKNNVWTFLCGGGGGGGGGAWYYSDDYGRWNCRGGSGGSGYTTQFNYNYISNTNYYLSVGTGGSGGRPESQTGFIVGDDGSTGGTTTFANKSAIGGEGGTGGGGGGGQNGSSGAGGSGFYPYGVGGSGGSGNRGRGGNGSAGVCRLNII